MTEPKVLLAQVGPNNHNLLHPIGVTKLVNCLHLMPKILLTAFLLLTWIASEPLSGQNSCDNALLLSNLKNGCSQAGAFQNNNASPSSFPNATCFSALGAEQWYFFIAEASDVNITILGNVTFGNFGTLAQPEAALYQGECSGSLQELECQSDASGLGLIELYEGGLVPGRRYLLRVRGRNNNRGSYQICINNYFPPADPSSDCPTGTILCDKSPFYVESVSGTGEDPMEMNDAPCLFFPGQNVETNSSWFQWTAANTGTLVFTLNPANPIDDLDFVLYELPSGLGDCRQKRILRCMAAGAAPAEYPTDCHGPTGLNFDALDISEPPGCSQGQDNFLRFVILQEGRSYALAINNFTAAGNGFTIEFGGSATFKGPDLEIQTDASTTLCSGDSIQFLSFFDQEDISGEAIQWTFGEGASLPSAEGPGPFDLAYDQGGTKTIVARALSKKGCAVIAQQQIVVGSLPNYTPDWAAPSCPDKEDGFVLLQSTEPQTLLALWDNGQSGPILENLAAGVYSVLVLTPEGCEKRDTFLLEAPEKIQFEATTTLAECGANNGQLAIEILQATLPVRFDWSDGQGFVDRNEIKDLRAGFYPLRLQDGKGCITDTLLWVNEFELNLDSINTLLTNPSCPGTQDGRIALFTQPGPLPFALNGDTAFLNPGPLTDLPAGEYLFTFRDTNQCLAFLKVVLEDPPSPVFSALTIPPSCADSFDALSEIFITGESPPYRILWSDGSKLRQREDLAQGDYTLTLTDSKSCEYLFYLSIPGPLPLSIDSLLIVDNLCFGDSLGSVQILASGGSGQFSISLEDKIISENEALTGLKAGSYRIEIQDSRGCRLTQNIAVGEGIPISAEAGQNKILELGSALVLEGSVFPPTGAYTYVWSPSQSLDCATCMATLASPTQSGFFYFQVLDENLCSALDSVWIEVIKNTTIFIPNAFSPNNDGVNDFFSVFINQGIEEVESMKIFNRWGALIYEGKNLSGGLEKVGWDGTFKGQPVDQGVYVYQIRLRFKDNTLVDYSGDVTILR
jgi:gliding motility-associated-like protein